MRSHGPSPPVECIEPGFGWWSPGRVAAIGMRSCAIVLHGSQRQAEFSLPEFGSCNTDVVGASKLQHGNYSERQLRSRLPHTDNSDDRSDDAEHRQEVETALVVIAHPQRGTVNLLKKH